MINTFVTSAAAGGFLAGGFHAVGFFKRDSMMHEFFKLAKKTGYIHPGAILPAGLYIGTNMLSPVLLGGMLGVCVAAAPFVFNIITRRDADTNQPQVQSNLFEDVTKAIATAVAVGVAAGMVIEKLGYAALID